MKEHNRDRNLILVSIMAALTVGCQEPAFDEFEYRADESLGASDGDELTSQEDEDDEFASQEDEDALLSLKIEDGFIPLEGEFADGLDGIDDLILTRDEGEDHRAAGDDYADTGDPSEFGATGHDWCVYVSQIGMSFGCVNLRTNPLGYYKVVTTRVGDPITPFHHAWYADYLGHTVVCPLNNSVHSYAACGYP